MDLHQEANLLHLVAPDLVRNAQDHLMVVAGAGVAAAAGGAAVAEAAAEVEGVAVEVQRLDSQLLCHDRNNV